ncbi:MAG TPA: hypothetical protein VHA37_07745 [Candidatus Saccharimonadales bacterium]|nr:hypothetical protein [Candidatus Saccharimonadales bacterium]
MSETTETAAPPPEVAPAADPAPAAPAPEQAAAPQAEPEAPATEPEKKPSQGDRRFAHLTARMAAETKAREEAERRAAAAEALLNARKEIGEDDPKPTRSEPSADMVRAEAEKLRAQERFNERRVAVVSAGTKEFGTDEWNAKTSVLAGMGATDNPVFMQALVELNPNEATRLVASLADDADELAGVLSLPPVAMAAKMGRMAAELSKPAPEAPRPPKVSAAPKPVSPVGGRAVPEPDIYSDKLSMAEYVARRNKAAPRHLGGRGGS